jgi:hypothetical protein
MLRTFAAFLDFCYISRRPILNEASLVDLNNALKRFHQYRTVFQETGVQDPEGLSLPRQHAMVHYLEQIRAFGAPNGLCSSITESKHIKAVKEPWRRSSHFNALGQMLLTNQRLDKLAAARVDFSCRHMLTGTCLSQLLGDPRPIPGSLSNSSNLDTTDFTPVTRSRVSVDTDIDHDSDEENECEPDEAPTSVLNHVFLARTRGKQTAHIYSLLPI